MNKYHQWIRDNVPPGLEAQLARCMDYAPKLRAAFPDELKLVKGVVFSPNNIDNYGSVMKQYPHCWCETLTGEIIDPTVEQFCYIGELQYRPFPDGTTSINRCMYCGAYYSNLESTYSPCCSAECHERF